MPGWAEAGGWLHISGDFSNLRGEILIIRLGLCLIGILKV